KASLAITFDDGYADNAMVALPILKKYKLPATFFIATGFLDNGRMWNDTVYETIRRLTTGEHDLSFIGLGKYKINTWQDRVFCAQEVVSSLKHLPHAERCYKAECLASIATSDLPNNLMMTSDQIRAMVKAGMEIGGHTVTHPILANLTVDEASQEIKKGAQQLEQITGKRVRLFAYPNGKPGKDYRSEHVKIVRDLGFEGAVSTSWGVSDQHTNIHELRRFTPWDRHQTGFILRLLRNYFTQR
ncbi:MAG: polysaccharide deacetylase family protein, partial [Sedimenticola sp.]|nr:polysaccharide deacetylase family protein [Sedimenticola sp.]